MCINNTSRFFTLQGRVNNKIHDSPTEAMWVYVIDKCVL